MENFYFTFGSDKRFPFQNGFLVVEADGLKSAISCFKEHYPNRPGSDALNCSDYYTEDQWNSILKEGFYQGELPKTVLSSNKKSVFLLISSDGYGIEYTKYGSKEEAAAAMKTAYKLYESEDIADDYIDSCYCTEDSAYLCNGENVYIWDIAEISVSLEKEEVLSQEELCDWNFKFDDVDAESLGEACYNEVVSSDSGSLEDIGEDLIRTVRDCKTQREYDLVNNAVIAITGSSLEVLLDIVKDMDTKEIDD